MPIVSLRNFLVTLIAAPFSRFHDVDEITWIPTTFLLTQAPALLFFGQLHTLFTGKWILLLSILGFELGSLLSGVSTSVAFLIAARAVQGVGAAGIFVGVLTMMAEIIALKDRPKFYGLFGAVFALSGILGPLIGGAFVDHVSWRWCFYINLPLAVPTLWVCMQFIRATPSTADSKNPPLPRPENQSRTSYVAKRLFTRLAKLDWVGCILFLGCTTCLVLALQWGGVEKPWNSADVVATLCVCAVTLTLFFAWENHRADMALMPLKLFRNRSLIGTSLAGMFARMGFFGAVYYLPLYFQAVKGHSPTKSGIDLMPITLAFVLSAVGSGVTVSKIGRYWHILVFGPLVGAVGYGLVFTMDEHSSWGRIIGYQILMGVGMGLTSSTTVAMQADMPKELIPQATSVMTYTQFLGGIIALAIAGGVFKTKLISGLHEFAPDAPVELLRKSVDALFHLPPEQRVGALHAYVKALQWTLAPLGIASSVCTSLSALIIRDLDVRKVKEMQDTAATASASPAEGEDIEAQKSNEKT
ncbi:MFS general substrate transporter [Auricularia subglabra TFB-10046 SS5]|nr:MFS general substrate transporter [Auricularia subglabra TFB-10046 SS5]